MPIFSWFLNALVTFGIAFFFIRLVGKRAVAHMSDFDLIMVMVAASFIARGLFSPDYWMQIIVTAGFFCLIYYVFTVLMLNNRFRRLVHDKPTVLISHGNINEQGLRKVRMASSELLSEIRLKGFTSIADVEFAIMEGEGKVSVIPRSEKAPLTAQDLKISKPSTGMPVPVILGGELIIDNLRFLERDQQWVEDQLSKHGLSSADIPRLSLLQVELDGTITLDIDESAMSGWQHDQNRDGQFNSRQQAGTALMPPYDGTSGIGEVAKRTLDQREHQSTQQHNPSPTASAPPSVTTEQLHQIMQQLQEQQASHQQLLSQLQSLLDSPSQQAQPQTS